MSVASKVLLGLSAVLVLFVGISGLSVMSTYNDCVAQEKGIKAQYKQNQNNYDNYSKKVLEVVQVPEIYTKDLILVTKTAISGRYGVNGSKAVFQFLKEHNPTLDSSLYIQIQRVIEAGRNSFEADQKTLLEKKRIYETLIGQFPTNLVAKLFNFPSNEVSNYDIVTSNETDKAFNDKKSAPIKLKN